MADFIADEADDVEFLAPVGNVHRINIVRPKSPRRAVGHHGAFRPTEPQIEEDAPAELGLSENARLSHSTSSGQAHSASSGQAHSTSSGQAHSTSSGQALLTSSGQAFTPGTPVSTASASVLARLYFQTVTPLIITDIFSLVFSALLGIAALLALSTVWHPLGRAAHVSPVHVLAFLPLLAAYWYGGLYPAIGMHPVVELQQITKLNTTAFLAVMATLLITGDTREWGAFFTVTWLVSMAAVPLARALSRQLCSGGSWWGYPAVVIGSGRHAADAVNALLSRPQSGLRPCGVIDPAGRSIGSVLGIPYLCSSEDLRPIVAYAVVVLPDMPAASLTEVLDTYRNRFPHLLVLSGVTGLPSLWRDPRDCGGGLAGVELPNKLLLPWPRFVKRATDLTLTTAAIFLAWPLLAGIALAVKVTSRGPALFGHTRLGRNGRRFTAWKFRTMRPDANAILQELLSTDPGASAEWERDHKLRNDPRVTCIGQWLRKTSLDELPQLWNVLTGDMSLVGPRPIVDAEIVRYGEIFRLYAEVPPGITGLWQVSGRNNTTYPERIRLDEFYVRNWSPWLDLHILVRTIKTIVRREGAY